MSDKNKELLTSATKALSKAGWGHLRGTVGGWYDDLAVRADLTDADCAALTAISACISAGLGDELVGAAR